VSRLVQRKPSFGTNFVDANGWPNDIFEVCPVGKRWPYALMMCLPAISRLIQCVKRYHDSKIRIHLINVSFRMRYQTRTKRYSVSMLTAARLESTAAPSPSIACLCFGDLEVSLWISGKQI
jgi:hypothetical protein